MKLIIIIPALNEEDSIAKVVNSIPKRIDGIDEIKILVIDDGSKDKTAHMAQEAGALVISHSYNRGVGGAFKTGLESSLLMGADIMVNIDADGQFSPLDIPSLIKPIQKKQAEFVYGNRFFGDDGKTKRPENMSIIKYWGNQRMSKLISFLTRRKFYDVSCGFRAYSKEALLRLNLTGNFTYTQESFLDLAFKGVEINFIPITVKYFKNRQSRVANNLFRYFLQTIKIIIRVYRDYRPLQFFGILGAIPFIIGFASSVFMIIHYINTLSFSPFKFVGFAAIYLNSLGIILWIIGLLADMFVRVRLNQEQILYYEKKRAFVDKD